jgi:predicted 3-demethylubiquinone-9 3-methyltransferase (glyoxalase superfamily)
METRVAPFLMFQRGDAEAAMELYVATLPDGRVLELERWGPEGPGAEGKLMRARFSIAGLEVMCFDSPVKHAFEFTPSSSLFVTCASEAELDRIAATLGEGGRFLMPLGSYGFSRKFAWLDDRFGVSWQLNLP